MTRAWRIGLAAAGLALAAGHAAARAEEAATKQRMTAAGSAAPAAVLLLETKEAVDSAQAAASLVGRKSASLLRALFARNATVTVIDPASPAPDKSSTVALPEAQFQFPYATVAAGGAERLPTRADPAAPAFEVRVPVLLKGGVFTTQEGKVLVADGLEAGTVRFVVDGSGNIYW